MDKYEFRRKRLLALRDEKCGGSSATLARKIERDPSYVARMLYAEGKDGKKRIAEDMVEIIERAFDVVGWFDQSKAENKAPTPATEKSPASLASDVEQKLVDHLVKIYLGLSPAYRDRLLDEALWLHHQEHPESSEVNPFKTQKILTQSHRLRKAGIK